MFFHYLVSQEFQKKSFTARKSGGIVKGIPYKTKAPVITGWPNLNITNDNAHEYFSVEPQNVAVLLGKDGSNLIDLDLDCAEACTFANYFALQTAFKYGRASKPFSHWIYVVTDGQDKPVRFKSPDGMILEIRGKGQATILPGSMHPSGEEYESTYEGDPTTVSFKDLYRSSALIAVCCLMVKCWPAKGGRNSMALALAGFLCKVGYSAEEVVNAVYRIAKFVGDEEADKRRATAEDTVKKFQTGAPIIGITALKAIMPVEIIQCLLKWFELSQQAEIDEMIETMNTKYAFIVIGGGQRILVNSYDAKTGRRQTSFMKLDAFKGLLKNNKICVGHGSKGPIYKTHAEAWLEHPQRRSYEGMAFEPGGDLSPLIYNYWQGFAIEPVGAPDGCQLFLNHLHQVICGGDDEILYWVLGWFADAVQNPGEKPGTALVFIGKQGSGKTCLIEYFGEILKPHYRKISNKKQLFGNFNAHQEGVLLLLCEEISIAQDPHALGIVKDLITSDHMMIEKKGLDAVPASNCLRLIITNNNPWVIPADADDRRFMVLEVSGEHVNDFDYFSALKFERENGGPAALLNFLQKWDYADVNLRRPPQTAAMVTQKIESMNPVGKIIYQFLLEGRIHPKGTDWPQMIETNQFQKICAMSIKLDGFANKGWETKVGVWLQKYLGPIPKEKLHLPEVDEETGVTYKATIGGATIQQTVYILPNLKECRTRFSNKTGIPFFEENV